MSGARVYLDWNARAPLREEARAAMLEAMDAVGNPSAVHAEGRAARAIVERARAEVAGLAGCEPDEVVFTSGATEAVAILARQGWDLATITGMEHAAVHAALAPAATPAGRAGGAGAGMAAAGAVGDGAVGFGDPANPGLPGPAYAAAQRWADFAAAAPRAPRVIAAATAAEGETGLLTAPAEVIGRLVAPVLAVRPEARILRVSDVTQALGKVPFAFRATGLDAAVASAQKLGGPPGVGALLVREGVALAALAPGGGQEGGRRGGTENVVGIAGFGAAAAAARRELEAGAGERLEYLRIILENSLAEAAPDLIIIGRGAARLPNTVAVAVPGWAGETQVMAMDLAGFAVSAGAACSSGRVRGGRVLAALGYEAVADCAIRVSFGPATAEAELLRFARCWAEAHRRRRSRAA